MSFDELPSEFQHRLLNYSVSTHVMPSTVEALRSL